MKVPFRIWIPVVVLAAVVGWVAVGRVGKAPVPVAAAPAAPNPALNVEVVQPAQREITLGLSASGSIAAWQEAVIGAEVGGLRLAEVYAQVGDPVRKGQVLAMFDKSRIEADVAQGRAALAEAEAALEEAHLNGNRARQVMRSGALSDQVIRQYLTAEKTAEARVQSARAQLDQQALRLRHASVTASDDGTISSRSATVGAVANEGQELFRLIRQDRLEWRAEVTAAQLRGLEAGIVATVEVPDTGAVTGAVRTVAPTVNEQNRNAIVYVDLPRALQAGLKPGMFATGEFRLGTQRALTVPQDALSLRDGFSYVFRLGEVRQGLARVAQVKVQLGRREGDQVEIVTGVGPGDRLVARGAAFLADGDTVRVVK